MRLLFSWKKMWRLQVSKLPFKTKMHNKLNEHYKFHLMLLQPFGAAGTAHQSKTSAVLSAYVLLPSFPCSQSCRLAGSAISAQRSAY